MVEQIICVHVVDPNRNRAKSIARHLSARSFCVEIHGGLSALLSRPRHGVLLMSDDYDEPDPAKVLEAIEAHTGYLPTAFFSSSLSSRRVVKATTAGIADYFRWPCSPMELGEIAVRLIVQAERRATLESLKAQARELVGRLTEREQEILRGLVAGASSKQIARELGIGLESADLQQADMMNRLNARSVADAVRTGIYAGLDESGGGWNARTRLEPLAHGTNLPR